MSVRAETCHLPPDPERGMVKPVKQGLMLLYSLKTPTT